MLVNVAEEQLHTVNPRTPPCQKNHTCEHRVQEDGVFSLLFAASHTVLAGKSNRVRQDCPRVEKRDKDKLASEGRDQQLCL